MMISLDILHIAEENFLITFGIVFGIGFLQGAILARGIRKKFPRLKKYAKGISLILGVTKNTPIFLPKTSLLIASEIVILSKGVT